LNLHLKHFDTKAMHLTITFHLATHPKMPKVSLAHAPSVATHKTQRQHQQHLASIASFNSATKPKYK
jgi:hypothetical protein